MMADQPEWKPIVQKMTVELEQAQSKEQLLSASIQDLLKQTTSLFAELHLGVMSETYYLLYKVEQMLQTNVQNLKCLKKERIMVLKELLIKEYEICKKLGCKALSFTANVLPTEQDLERLKLYVQKQEIEKTRLENVFTDIRRSIIKMMDDLDISPSSPFEELVCKNPEEFVLSANNMTKLREFRDELQGKDTKCRIEKMKEDLLVLWKYLDEPVDVCQLFLEMYRGYNTNTVNAFGAEIKRCKEKRKENISKYVTQIRHELLKLWDLCKYCEAERNKFAPFHCNTFTEDLLTLHELEVERLRKFYNDNRTMFELLEQHENLVIKTKKLLQQANNPDRLHNRGGQLLKEEKERKVIQKKLPKIEAELKQLINEYEAKHNQIFTINGMSLKNVIAETWESITLEEETMKKARKEAKDKSIKKSPLNSPRPGPSYLSVHKDLTPSKRKLFSPSPNSSIKCRNKNGDKNKPTVIVSKVRRSGKFPKIKQKSSRSSKGGQRKKESPPPANSTTDTTYNQFQGHITGREELHSSMLPEQIQRININKTPERTPMK